ncbi:MAG: DNA polymerase IV [Syntrophales bacterium]|nr:DNA polymerase IV [Syntrophales bacterium]
MYGVDRVFSLSAWPLAIVHVDGDAFFTSCEEALHPMLRGRPLVTGGERGIVACANYVAKRMGIKRGLSLRDARRICPQLVVLPSDYETYSLFSRRMFAILRRFTPQVEEYSIDEAFADITGLRSLFRSSYEEIAKKMKEDIFRELGITVSVGLSITKVLAKLASRYHKPDGFTVIEGREIAFYLKDIPVGDLWGIGPATADYLNKIGVLTALDFAQLPEAVVKRCLAKPGVEIWREIRGESVYPVSYGVRDTRVSISKTKTFAPPTTDREYIFAHLLRNLESACMKARRFDLVPRKLVFYLKKQDTTYSVREIRLPRPSNLPLELVDLLRQNFEEVYQINTLYRATGVILSELLPDTPIQYDLFEDPLRAERIRKIYEVVDCVNDRFGKHTLHLGGSHLIEVQGDGRRGPPTIREAVRFLGETRRRHIGLPLLRSTSFLSVTAVRGKRESSIR